MALLRTGPIVIACIVGNEEHSCSPESALLWEMEHLANSYSEMIKTSFKLEEEEEARIRSWSTLVPD